METSHQNPSVHRPSESTRPLSAIRCGKGTSALAPHTDPSVDATPPTKDGVKQDPFDLEPHPILVRFTGEATEHRAVDAFSKGKLQALLASIPIVEVVLMRGRHWVIREWEAVRLARRHKAPTILIKVLTFSTKDKLRDYIYMTCFLATQIVPGRQLSAFQSQLNTVQVESKSELLTGSPARQRMNGMPVSTGYRLKGPTPGTTRGRKKTQKPAETVPQLTSDPPIMPTSPHAAVNQRTDLS